MRSKVKSFLSIFLLLILTGCAKDSSLPMKKEESSYDGLYYDYDSIVNKGEKEVFTIENGELNTDSINAKLNEDSMKLVSEKENFTFTYDYGEFVVLDKNKKSILVGYKENSKSYKYIQEIYGDYSERIEPNLQEIVKKDISEITNGKYTNTNFESMIHQIDIKNENLAICYEEDSKEVKDIELSFDNILFDEPQWDKDWVESVDKTMLKNYVACKTIDDIQRMTGFNIKFSINNSKEEYIILNFPQTTEDEANEIGISIVSKSLLGAELIDDIFEKSTQE
ncbi:hypothetical protein [Enterococcus sp. CWB-B31]|uniref:hypothetical protein n=1 Tax=Enterococcus sp. CWB-B31 TaxID=2885159 RepID=UPI001E2F4FFE|nr:hypothetical protein [Enterococcus sp. CWB-B31]MCB5955089.1 hypothetical protein [Enterococcus sp. CWB-B31]